MWKISFCSRPLFQASSTFGLASNHHQPLVHFVVQELGSPVARCQLLTNAAKASFPSQTVCVYGSQKNVQEWSKLLLHVALYLSLFLSLSHRPGTKDGCYSHCEHVIVDVCVHIHMIAFTVYTRIFNCCSFYTGVCACKCQLLILILLSHLTE